MDQMGRWKGKYKGEDVTCDLMFSERFSDIQGNGQLVKDRARKFSIEGKGITSESTEWMGWSIGKDDDIAPNNFFLRNFKLNLDTGLV